MSELEAEGPSPTNPVGLAGLASAIGQVANRVGLLKDRLRMLEAVIENFPGGISLFDHDLNMVLCNEQQKKLLEYPGALFAYGNPSMEDIFRLNAARGEYGPGDVEEQVARRMALARLKRPHVYERTRPNGTVLEVRGAPLEGGGFVTTYLDVTEQRRTQALVAHMAHHDALTDLPNRALFSDRLQNAVALAKRSGLVALHYIDVDNFKPVNDNFGHQTGDALLIAIAHRLSRAVRENDTVARLGGDEFAIIQTGIREVIDAAVLARRILAELNRPFDLSGRDVMVGASIGIAFAPLDGTTCDEVLGKADTALYRSKSGGRGQFTLHRGSAAA